jgi:hypothetical protein
MFHASKVIGMGSTSLGKKMSTHGLIVWISKTQLSTLKRVIEMSKDHEIIYLQPNCCVDPFVGRLWREDDEFGCEVESTKYVRKDIHDAQSHRIEQLEAAIMQRKHDCYDAPGGISQADKRLFSVLEEPQEEDTNAPK